MEFLDIVTDDNRVVGTASKAEVYRRQLTHRIVHVLVFNKRGELLLQRRSGLVAFCPHHWVTSASGHVRSGETFEQAALREAREEIGVELNLDQTYRDLYNDPRGMNKVLTTFTATHEGPFRMDPKDLEELRFVSLPDVWAMIRNNEPFHPELLFLLYKHYS